MFLVDSTPGLNRTPIEKSADTMLSRCLDAGSKVARSTASPKESSSLCSERESPRIARRMAASTRLGVTPSTLCDEDHSTNKCHGPEIRSSRRMISRRRRVSSSTFSAMIVDSKITSRLRRPVRTPKSGFFGSTGKPFGSGSTEPNFRRRTSRNNSS